MSIRNILHNPQRVIWPYRKKGAQTRGTALWRKQKRRKKRKMTFNRIIRGTTTRSINMALLQAWQMNYIIKHEGVKYVTNHYCCAHYSFTTSWLSNSGESICISIWLHLGSSYSSSSTSLLCTHPSLTNRIPRSTQDVIQFSKTPFG